MDCGNKSYLFLHFEGVNKEKSTLRAGGVWTTSTCFHQCHHKCYVCVYLFDTAYYALCDSGSPVTLVNYDIVPNELYAFIEPT